LSYFDLVLSCLGLGLRPGLGLVWFKSCLDLALFWPCLDLGLVLSTVDHALS
jgi:hypothetical protein